MEDRPNMYRIFVYGTLKRGQPNHYIMADVNNGLATFVGEAQTIETYPLVIASKYNIPFLLDKKGVGLRIRGEVFDVDERMLQRLDELESHPKYYLRRLEPVQLLTNDSSIGNVPVTIECWIYFLPKYRPQLLNLVMLDSYDADGAHGLKYVERYLRSVENYAPYEDVMGQD